jgi:hypothetical protein
MKRALTTLTIVALMFTASACSGKKGDDPEKPDTPTENANTSGGSGNLPEIPMGGTGVISGLETTNETMDPGTEVSASGKFTMPEGESGNVFISVSWVNSENSSVYARGVQTIEGVEAGSTHEWSVSANLPADAVNVATVKGAKILDQ